MVCHPRIYCTLIRLSSSISLPYLSCLPPSFSSFQCVPLCHLLTQMECILRLFSLYHSLLLFHLLLIPSNSPSIVKTHPWSCLYLCSVDIYLLDLSYTWEKNMSTLSFQTWCTLLNMMTSSSIHLPTNLQTTKFHSSLCLNNATFYIYIYI
jgi:hypothetical protein